LRSFFNKLLGRNIKSIYLEEGKNPIANMLNECFRNSRYLICRHFRK
jgi:hypothetical protein